MREFEGSAPPNNNSISTVEEQKKNKRRTVYTMLKADKFDTIPPEWLEEFEAAARRPLAIRMRYAFIHTYKPVLDDAPYRAFDSMAEYRRWCEENLPEWLGYGRI